MTKTKDASSAKSMIERLLRDKVIPDLVESVDAPFVSPVFDGTKTQVAVFEFNEIIAFANLLIEGREDEALLYSKSLLSKGFTSKQVILDFLGPVASLLGDMWCNDTCSFADVTLGLSSLHKILRLVSRSLKHELNQVGNNDKVMLTAMPGDTHIFGLAVLEVFFAESGWRVDALFDRSFSKIIQQTAESAYCIVGLSVSCDGDLEKCKHLITQIRKNSKNRNIKIIVGGPAFFGRENLFEALKADSYAYNAIHALEVAGVSNNRSITNDSVR